MPAAPAKKKRRLLRWSLGILAVATLTIALSSAWFYWQLKRSLPLLDGETSLASAGLSAPVTIERDALGVPTIRAASRPDAARALGFLHAQERFFQMDLARRKAAGELSALLGEAALDADRSARIHNFATNARATLAQLPPAHRALLEAYAAGANAGLSQLRARPFEYILLRREPAPWKPEDSLLVIHSMWLDLQDENGSYERSLAALRDRYGPAAANAFAPAIAPDDLALDGSTAPLPPLPTSRQLNLRKDANDNNAPASSHNSSASSSDLLTTRYPLLATSPESPGSNSLAVAGAHTATGAALLASDMHLALRVPNIWYRATLDFPSPDQPTRTRITGVTLPGLPVVIAGSNGHIAWGFTNAHADTVDLIAITASDINSADYYVHEGRTLEFQKRSETIAVRGADPVTHEITLSPWGPVIGENAKRQRLALKWLAHDPAATNLELLALETATTTPAAVAIAHRIGIPTMNFLVADSTGDIAWTLAGKLPNRIGYDGRFPVTMSFGDRRWEGFVPENQIPVIGSQIENRESKIKNLATANQRLLGGDAFTLIGDGGYPPAYRAARIHERLATAEKATPADLLAIQLDDRAAYLDRWQQLLVKTLTADITARRDKRAPLLAAVSNWQGRATTDSASYTLVRSFRRHVIARALDPLFAHIAERHPDFSYTRFRYQPALDRLLEEQPLHLLAPEYEAWSDLLLAAADDVLADLKEKDLGPAEATWGSQNTARIRHPLSSALPGFLAKYLNMPADPLAGDNDVPRVQTPSFGASQRFVVSPGRESEGIFHMPGGQSGHPLSPYHRAGHDVWVKGEPTPFLPGPTQHTLTLTLTP